LYFVFNVWYYKYVIYSYEPMDQENKKTIESENIFDEFSQGESLVQEVKKTNESFDRDIFFYVSVSIKVLIAINIFLFTSFIVLIAYVYIQNDTQGKNIWFLQPVCGIIVWDIKNSIDGCKSVTSLNNQYKTKLEDAKVAQTQTIVPLLGEEYALKNYNFSKKVLFLLDKSESRLKPLDILSEFDALKLMYEPIDKAEITCFDIEISNDDVLNISCEAYSSDWDTKIVDLNNGNIGQLKSWGTSITRAISFMNFIENAPNSPFKIIEKTNILNAEDVDLAPYTKKTVFQLQLKYSKKQLLF